MADKESEPLAVATSTENPDPATPAPAPETATTNEPIAKGIAAPKVGLREKIRRATAPLWQAAGLKKGKGRPKKCRNCDGMGCPECNWTCIAPGKGDETLSLPLESQPENARVEIPIAGADSPAVDSARASLFRRSVTSACRSVLKILTGIVRVYMDAAGLDGKFSDRALSKCEPTPEALERWTESLDAVLKKHSVEPKHSEEIALAVNTCELVAPFGILLAELKGEIRRQREAKPTK